MRSLVRRLLTYVLIGVLLAYVSTLIVVGLLPVPTFSYSCQGRIHQAELGDFRPYLRLRVWPSPHGVCFQIHRTTARALDFYADAVPEDRREAWMNNPRLDDPSFIPAWSLLRKDWPSGLRGLGDCFQEGAAWYEVLMGWPIPCLYGRYTMGQSATDRMQNVYGAFPVYRNLTFSSGTTMRDVVAMPLIPSPLRFAASAVFYGACVFALVRSIRGIRRWYGLRRLRRGCCVKCGYDLRGSPGRCPECGNTQ